MITTQTINMRVAILNCLWYNYIRQLILRGDLNMSMQNNSFDKNQLIKKQKKSWLIATIVIAICCVAMLVGVIVCFASGESGLAIFSLVMFIPSLIATIYFICTYKNRTDNDWIVDYLETKHLTSSTEGFELLKQANVVPDSSFVLNKSIDIIGTGWSATKLLIDNQNKKFIYQKGKKYSKTYSFSDLINYEVYENGKSQVQGRAGSALIGGAFFGLGGAIVGGNRSRSINEKCNQLKLILRVNDFNCPEIVITYVNNVDVDKSSSIYRNMKSNLQSVCSMLEYMLNENTLEQSSANKQEEKNSVNASSKKQLKELKEMLDDGLITQEDYEQKKKQILGL